MNNFILQQIVDCFTCNQENYRSIIFKFYFYLKSEIKNQSSSLLNAFKHTVIQLTILFSVLHSAVTQKPCEHGRIYEEA